MAVTTSAIRPQTGVQITSRRLTCAGIQYTIQDGEQTHITTFSTSGQFISCTCGYEHYNLVCAHRRVAQSQEDAYAIEAQKREEYVIACSIY
jgi:hypothetical protein